MLQANYFHCKKHLVLFIILSFLLISACKTVKNHTYISGKLNQSNEIIYDWKAIKYSNLINNQLRLSHLVDSFYVNSNYQPAWFEELELTNNAQILINQLGHSAINGINNKRYNLIRIQYEIQKLNALKQKGIVNVDDYFFVDAMLTEAYFQYASDLLTGSINPNAIDILWESHPRSKDLISYLEQALTTDSVQKSLENLHPEFEQYKKLQKELRRLLRIKKSNRYFSPGQLPNLQLHDSSVYVTTVKKYLKLTGDLVFPDNSYYSDPVFDDILEVAVKRFQLRHGALPDGVVNSKTNLLMQKSLDAKINMVRINMERLRWLPENPGKKYVMINLPAYTLSYYENDRILLKMKVVVGEQENHTPVLIDTMSYLVINPTWNVPFSIARDEILPKIKKDSNYLERKNFVLLENSYVDDDTIHPDSVHWNNINKENFPFFLVQEPGINNPLGDIKFIFPNNQSIYMHDTPADHLFDENNREFSHGCIRLEKPVELALKILDNQIEKDSIANWMMSDETKRVYINDTVGVYLVYHTAWVDAAGQINFRDDIYNFDRYSIPLLDLYPARKISDYLVE